MDDRAIIAMLAARDEGALAALETQYGRLCHTIAMGILGSNEDAEECVNDVWLKLWQNIPPEEPTSLAAYAAMLARCLALNRLKHRTAARRDARAVIPTPLDELAEILPGGEEVHTRLEAAEVSAAVNAYLATLDAATRVMFVRRYWHMEPLAEIAARMGLREGTVRVKLHRVRQRLKAELKRRNLL